MFAMPNAVRAFICLAIVLTSSLGSAQIADPWAQNPAPSAEPAPPSEQTPSSERPTNAAPAPTNDSAAPTASSPPNASPTRAPRKPTIVDPWEKPVPAHLGMRRPGDWIAHPAPVMRPKPLADAVFALPPQAETLPPRRYPFEIADRPLVLPPGVTELDVSFERRTFVNTKPDKYGYVMPGRTSSSTPDVAISHAFSRAELGLGVGQLGYAWIGFDTRAVPERVSFSLAFSSPHSDGSYAAAQTFAVSHKLWREPGHAALIGMAAIETEEVGVIDPNGALVTGEVLAAGSGLTLRAQATQKFALWFSGTAVLPVVSSFPVELDAVLSGSTGLVIAFDSWDIFATGGLGNVTQNVVTYLSLGFRKRWGL
jgi:hypothetical protein